VTKLALVALAAMALTAAIGSASASAHTVLCAEHVTTCPANKIEPAGTYFNAGTAPGYGTEMVLRPSFILGGISCEYGLISTRTTSSGGNPLGATVTGSTSASGCGFTSSGGKGKKCNQFSFGSAEGSLEPTGGGDGVIRMGSEASPLLISFECFNFEEQIACTYKLTGAPLTYNNAAEPQYSAKEATATLVSQTKGSTSWPCNKTGAFTLKLKSDGGANKGISQYSETVICSEIVTTCPSNKIEPSGTYFNAGVAPGIGEFTMRPGGFLISPITCKYALLASRSAAAGGNPLSSTETGSTTAENCSFYNSPSCSSFSMGTAPGSIEATGGGNGVIKMGTAAEPLLISFDCYNSSLGEQYACTFKLVETPLTYNTANEFDEVFKVNGAPISLVSQTKGGSGSGIKCNTGTLTVKARPDTAQGKGLSTF
jgi:hypothetical protein